MVYFDLNFDENLDWMTEKIDDINLGDTRPANIKCDNDSQITLTEKWIQRASH